MCAQGVMDINKIGAKVLPQVDFELMLPNYKNIDNQLKKIQEIATQIGELNVYDETDPEFIKHHNNVFSILGERGSGKTSILLSLKYYLMKLGDLSDETKEGKEEPLFENINSNAIFLPIVIPQDMDDDSDSLGWIIGFFRKYVREADQKINEDKKRYKDFISDCSYRTDSQTKISEAYEELTKTYILRKEEFRKKILTNNFTGTLDYVKSNTETLNLDISLTKRFNDFINTYIKFKKVGKSSTRLESEPLIFLFFDDVDLSNRKCLDVLETIMRYLCHPNIVVFIAGEYNAFKEALTIEFLRRDNLLDAKMMMNNYINELEEPKSKNESSLFNFNEEDKNNTSEMALNIRKNLAYDYLKKVLSPALRFDLPKLNDIQKSEFGIKSRTESRTESRANSKTLMSLIEDKFNLKSNEAETNFLRYGKKQEPDIIYSYFSIFDSKPRGLTNVYYYLENTSQVDLCEFVEVIINSDYELQKNSNKIKKVLILDKEKRIEIKYDLILGLFDSDWQLQKRVLMLCLFVGNIHNIKQKNNLAIYTQELKEIALKVFNQNLKNIKADFQLLPNIQTNSEENFKYLLKLYEELSKFNNFEGMFSLVEYLNILNALEEKKIVTTLENCYKKDELWIKSILNKLFLEENVQIDFGIKDECINRFAYIARNRKLHNKVNSKLLAIKKGENFEELVKKYKSETSIAKENIDEEIISIRQKNIVLKISEDLESAVINLAYISKPMSSLLDELTGDKYTGLLNKQKIFENIQISKNWEEIQKLIDLNDSYEIDLNRSRYQIEADELIFLLQKLESNLENELWLEDELWLENEELIAQIKATLAENIEKLYQVEENYGKNSINEKVYRKNIEKIFMNIWYRHLSRILHEESEYYKELARMNTDHYYIMSEYSKCDLDEIRHIKSRCLENRNLWERIYLEKYILLGLDKSEKRGLLQDEIEYDIQKIINEHEWLKSNAEIATSREINLLMKKYDIVDRMQPKQKLVDYVNGLNQLEEIMPDFNEEYDQIEIELDRCRDLEYENQSVLEEIYNEEIAELMRILYLSKNVKDAAQKNTYESQIQEITKLELYGTNSRLKLYVERLMSDN